GSKSGRFAARRGHALARAAVVDSGDQNHPQRGSALGILPQAADVPTITGGAGGNPKNLGLGNDQVEQAMRLHLTESPLRIGGDHGGPFMLDAELNPGSIDSR